MNVGLVWFRQDLRLVDNPAFIEACHHHDYVIPLYIFDEGKSVLGRAQAWWLHHSLHALDENLKQQRLNLVLRRGNPIDILLALVDTYDVRGVYWNRCYDHETITRDTHIKATLLEKKVIAKSYNGVMLFEPWTVQNKQGGYFKVFTPFWKHCLSQMVLPQPLTLSSQPAFCEVGSDSLSDWHLLPSPNWAADFHNHWTPGEKGAQLKLETFISHHLAGYKTRRDFPCANATSKLSPHLHFGEISPWRIVSAVEQARLHPQCDEASASHFLSELGWREFSVHLLYHFPQLATQNFKQEFNEFPWREDHPAYLAWQKGRTGYPIVDAGMRELWHTGYMHNRVRMIVASFLTKHLLVDWRLGADWFLDTLLDADLANNSASWQWVAGCGADAAPYFRIFNPILQSQKFDPQGDYIRRWIPELGSLDDVAIHQPWTVSHTQNYPAPIVAHEKARLRALASYQALSRPSSG